MGRGHGRVWRDRVTRRPRISSFGPRRPVSPRSDDPDTGDRLATGSTNRPTRSALLSLRTLHTLLLVSTVPISRASSLPSTLTSPACSRLAAYGSILTVELTLRSTTIGTSGASYGRLTWLRRTRFCNGREPGPRLFRAADGSGARGRDERRSGSASPRPTLDGRVARQRQLEGSPPRHRALLPALRLPPGAMFTEPAASSRRPLSDACFGGSRRRYRRACSDRSTTTLVIAAIRDTDTVPKMGLRESKDGLLAGPRNRDLRGSAVADASGSSTSSTPRRAEFVRRVESRRAPPTGWR